MPLSREISHRTKQIQNYLVPFLSVLSFFLSRESSSLLLFVPASFSFRRIHRFYILPAIALLFHGNHTLEHFSIHSFVTLLIKNPFFRKNAVQMSYAIKAFLITLKMSEIQFRSLQYRNRLTIFSSTLKCWNAKIDPIQLRILLQI